MEFMEQQVTVKSEWVEVEGSVGTTWVYREEWEGPLDNSQDLYITESGVYEAGEYTVKTIQGFGARLSAPGYLDCTEWVVFDTESEAEEYLKEQYGDDDEEQN
jgi:hypothetical protein